MRLALPLLVLAVLLQACTTTSGSGFASGYQKDRKAHASGTNESKDEPAPAGLSIDASPSEALIEFNGSFAGRGHAFLPTTGLGGSTLITVSAPAYRTQVFRVVSMGQSGSLRADLEPITGYLTFAPDPLATTSLQIQIDGRSVPPSRQTVPIGTHVVTWRQFGFVPASATVFIQENLTTTLALLLTPAVFALSELGTGAVRAFNPALTGPDGRVRLRFAATAPGTATLVILDTSGTEVWRKTFDHLDFSVSESWLGLGPTGPLPDGSYTLVLTGHADGESDREWARNSVTIDHTLIKYAAGLLWVPTPDVVLPGVVGLTMSAAGHVESVGGTTVAHFPLDLSLATGLAPGLELQLRTAVRLWSVENLDSLYGDLWIKQNLLQAGGGTALSAQVGAGFATWLQPPAGFPTTDYWTRDPAIKVALPASWGAGPLRLLFTPELDLSLGSALTSWAYGRVGMNLDLDPWNVGLSGAVRSTALNTPLALDGPVRLAAELSLRLLDDLPVTLGMLFAAEVYTPVNYAIYGGFAVKSRLDTLDLASR